MAQIVLHFIRHRHRDVHWLYKVIDLDSLHSLNSYLHTNSGLSPCSIRIGNIGNVWHNRIYVCCHRIVLVHNVMRSGVRPSVLCIKDVIINSMQTCVWTCTLAEAEREIDIKSYLQKFLMIVSTVITCTNYFEDNISCSTKIHTLSSITVSCSWHFVLKPFLLLWMQSTSVNNIRYSVLMSIWPLRDDLLHSPKYYFTFSSQHYWLRI